MINYVFIDMDNTIAENITCDNVDFYPGLYLNKRPINIVIQGILALYPNSYYIILSKTSGSVDGIMEKREWLSKYSPYAYQTLLLSPSDSKKEVLAYFIESNHIDPGEVLLIDDKKSILQDCKTLGIDVKYPQQIICDYENIFTFQNNVIKK